MFLPMVPLNTFDKVTEDISARKGIKTAIISISPLFFINKKASISPKSRPICCKQSFITIFTGSSVLKEGKIGNASVIGAEMIKAVSRNLLSTP